MKNEALLRKWLLDVDATGLVTVRQRGSKAKPQGLPVWSTDEVAQAIALRALHCVVAMDPLGNLHWQLIDPPKGVHELLERITPMFGQSYERMLAGDSARERDALAQAGGTCPGCGAPRVSGKATCGQAKCGPAARWS